MGHQKTQKRLFKRAYEATKKALRHTVLGATLALGIGMAAVSGCGRSAPYPPCPEANCGCRDAGADVEVRVDSQPKQDVGPAQDSGTDSKPQTDGGVPPQQIIYTFKNLIGDSLDRELLDRGKGLKSYQTGSDIAQDSNPFSDGTGSGNLGVAQTDMYRIDGTSAPEFSTATLTDQDAAKSYEEQQDLWVSGDSHYSESAADVVAHVTSFAYTLKFKGVNDDFGIPVCTTPANSVEYAKCIETGENLDYATAVHRLGVKFLGDDWVVTEMVPPSGAALSTETQLASGGYIKLAKEAISGILNAGESLTVDNLMFRYDDFDSTNPNNVAAIVSILDANGNILKKDKVYPGTTKEFVINGKSYLFHVYKVAPGYTFGANWIDCAIFADEIKLQSGQALDPDNGNNPYVKAILGWKNKGASATDTQPDHLRTVILYSDDIANLASGNSNDLMVGDYIPIVQEPVKYELQYKGLTNGNQSTLQYSLERNSDYQISATYGPNGQACTIKAPFVKVISSLSGAAFDAFSVSGSDNQFLIATNGGTCGSTAFPAGTLFIRQSPASAQWVKDDYVTTGYVNYPTVADGSPGIAGGQLSYSAPQHSCGDGFLFGITEKAGVGASADKGDKMFFRLKLDGASSTFNIDAPGSMMCNAKKDSVSYLYAGPVSTGYYLAGEGTITERGSQFYSMSDTLVEFRMAGQLVYTQYVLVKK